jgi:nucleotide-binding universal stress UspA family protein
MVQRPSVVCAVDFSQASRGALRYAAALAEHFQGDLTVLTVDDPLLSAAAASSWGEGWLAAQSKEHLHTFLKETFPHRAPQLAVLDLVVKTGQPAAEILDTAVGQQADLIVMSSHGTTGFRRWVFGSTTARLLRQTSLPVLVTPATDPGPDHLEDLKRTIRTILVPVDLSSATNTQVQIATGLAEAFDSKVLLAHVLEPIERRPADDSLVAQIDTRRRQARQETLAQLKAKVPTRLKPEVILAYGNPSHEIARIAQQRQAGAIVMGMHAPAGLVGPRIGSVTYRVLCEVSAMILVLPPRLEGKLSVAPERQVVTTG